MKAVLGWCGIYSALLIVALLIHEVPVRSYQNAMLYGLFILVNLGLALLIKYRA